MDLRRRLVELPPNICTPQFLADVAAHIATSAPEAMRCQVTFVGSEWLRIQTYRDLFFHWRLLLCLRFPLGYVGTTSVLSYGMH